eukprot:4716491-Amphidinium_carterae.1
MTKEGMPMPGRQIQAPKRRPCSFHLFRWGCSGVQSCMGVRLQMVTPPEAYPLSNLMAGHH